MKLCLLLMMATVCICCQTATQPNISLSQPKQIAEIALPTGFQRITTATNTFEYWLQHYPLLKDNTVYLYNGSLKANQYLHAAVLDISIGNKNLQQCADAVVRLKAEYHFARKEYHKIVFNAGKTVFDFNAFASKKNCFSHECLLEFLENVFNNYGTLNLEDQLHAVTNYSNLTIGNVFIKGGGPGHAMLVVDVAVNATTSEKIFLLAQSFMPAQSVHVVKNLNNTQLSPWYSCYDAEIATPGWTFTKTQLKKW